MRCPVCQQPLHEHEPVCPHCAFDLAVAGRTFGEPVELEFPLTDLVGTLSFWKKHKAREALLGMSHTFPQLRFAAVITELDKRVPLASHTFWLFNTGGLNAPQESGGQCRLVLLELDITNQRAACMIAYGLEPFIPQEKLNRIAAAAVPWLHQQDHAGAIIAALQCARTEFAAIAKSIPASFGLFEGGQTTGAGNEEAAFAY